MPRAVVWMIFVWIAHFSVGIALYAGRSNSVSQVFQSSPVVFLGPLIIAFVAYLLLAWCALGSMPGYLLRALCAVVISLCCVVTSEMAKLFVALNIYGG
jgi:hypothetical protein